MILRCLPPFRVAQVRSRSVPGNGTPTSQNHEIGGQRASRRALARGWPIRRRPAVDDSGCDYSHARPSLSRSFDSFKL